MNHDSRLSGVSTTADSSTASGHALSSCRRSLPSSSGASPCPWPSVRAAGSAAGVSGGASGGQWPTPAAGGPLSPASRPLSRSDGSWALLPAGGAENSGCRHGRGVYRPQQYREKYRPASRCRTGRGRSARVSSPGTMKGGRQGQSTHVGSVKTDAD